MLPGIHGFHWEAGHLIFVGLFMLVFVVIATTWSLAALKTGLNFKRAKADAILWKEDFHDLPRQERRCRHELDGYFRERTCDKSFDCRGCETHAKLVAAGAVGATGGLHTEVANVAGLDIPLDRFYHRGHTWVRPESDGTVTVGLDSFAQSVFGPIEQVSLPEPGKKISVNGIAWRMVRKGKEVRVLSPVEGVVVATGKPEDGYLLKVRPDGTITDLRHLLAGKEVMAWINREFERLQAALSPSLGPALADGGAMVDNFSETCSKNEWDHACSSVFLEP